MRTVFYVFPVFDVWYAVRKDERLNFFPFFSYAESKRLLYQQILRYYPSDVTRGPTRQRWVYSESVKIEFLGRNDHT